MIYLLFIFELPTENDILVTCCEAPLTEQSTASLCDSLRPSKTFKKKKKEKKKRERKKPKIKKDQKV